MKLSINGIYPKHNKITRREKIAAAPLPAKVILPLQQHIGQTCEPLVGLGEKVKAGQKIAGSAKGLSAPIHAPISGTVSAIKKEIHPSLKECKAITIESDGRMEYGGSIIPRRGIERLEKEELKRIIKEAGIVGLGGAAFPTYAKLSPPPDKKIDTIIINGAECEPHLTCDHRVMLEHAEKVIKGIRIIMKILEPEHAYIGIESNKENAIELMDEKILEMKLQKEIKVIRLDAIYPQGAEKNLIYSITGRKVPIKGGLPMDVGVVVQNVQTAKAVYDAVYENKPLIERVITVTGAVNEPKNILARIGTPIRELIGFCKGYSGSVGKIIMGGPMTGVAQFSEEVPVIKGSSGILVQRKRVIEEEEKGCIRCGRCIEKCPIGLMPSMIFQNARKGDIESCKKLFVSECYECGCCSYVCPSKIPLTHWMRYAKDRVAKG
ncbi:electron transport complex subunit RsxC [Candidatus Woesearchaeota archaeon]|nr:electron transport complex subunit RsxC [Candidatus Woesearchaeota archaeon]